MGLKATGETAYGEERELYWRLNNFEQLANHGVPAAARFRAFLSKDAFEAGKNFVTEKVIEFQADVSKPMWEQAYEALRQEEGFKKARKA